MSPYAKERDVIQVSSIRCGESWLAQGFGQEVMVLAQEQTSYWNACRAANELLKKVNRRHYKLIGGEFRDSIFFFVSAHFPKES